MKTINNQWSKDWGVGQFQVPIGGRDMPFFQEKDGVVEEFYLSSHSPFV